MSQRVDWVADIAPVREVSLLGDADLAYWTARLEREQLTPAPHQGHAQLLLIAAEMRFWGVLFQELSFSVLVERPAATGADESPASFLLAAYNSNSFFAWCERVFFATPYEYGDVRVDAFFPVSMRLLAEGEPIFSAEIGTKVLPVHRTALRRGPERFEGPVFLPPAAGEPAERSGVFVARLEGNTEVFPFVPHEDELAIAPGPACPILQELVDSQFVVREWIVREQARHAKSKTYRRSELPPFQKDA